MPLSPEVLDFLRRRTLEDAGRIRGGTIGRHRAVTRSQGRDFLEYRSYAPGDDFRDIDWRTSGRVDRVVVRQTEGEQRLGLMLALDAGGAMNYGEGATKRWQYARQVIESLGWLAQRQSDALGILAGCDGEVRAIAMPISNRFTDPVQLQSRLSGVQPAGLCPWEELIRSIRRRTRGRGSVLVISDLLDLSTQARDDPKAAANATFTALAELMTTGHHVVVLQLIHPDELEFPWRDVAQVQFECSRGLRSSVETDAGALRDGYRASLSEYLRGLEASAARERIPLVRARTDAPLVSTLTDLLDALAGHVQSSRGEAELAKEAGLS